MGPLNDKLFRLQAASTSDPAVIDPKSARDMVAWWARLHIMRSLMPLLGALVGSSLILG